MDRLQYDVIDLIVDILWRERENKSHITPCLCLSHQWQHAVEKRVFASITVANYELDKFSAIFDSPVRRQALRTLRFKNVQHEYDTSHGRRWNRVADQQIFRTSTKRLLEILRSWEQRPFDASRLRYSLYVDAWLDAAPMANALIREPVDIENPGSTNVYLHLDGDDLDRLLPITAVRDLDMGGYLHPSSISQLAGVFPNLESLSIRYIAISRSLPKKRVKYRVAFARSLAALHGKFLNLIRFNIDREDDVPWNQSFACLSSVDHEGVDELCEAIRRLCQPTVRELNVATMEISVDLLRDRRGGSSGSDSWPALRELTIGASPVMPDARWLYTGDPEAYSPASLKSWEDDSSDSDRSDSSAWASDDDGDDGRASSETARNGSAPQYFWRDTVDPDTFGDLVRELTTAIQGGRMPSLQAGYLRVESAFCSLSIEYADRGAFRIWELGQLHRELPATQKMWSLEMEGAGFEALEDLTREWKDWVGDDGRVEAEVREERPERALVKQYVL